MLKLKDILTTFTAGCVFVLTNVASVNAQTENSNQKKSSDQKQVAVINFFAEVNNNTIGNLTKLLSRTKEYDLDKVILVINSSGGIGPSGRTAYNILSESFESKEIKLHTHNIGTVQSAATFLYCAGNIRTASTSSHFLFHEGGRLINQRLTEEEFKEHYYLLREGNKLAEKITEKCSNDQTNVENLLKIERVLSAERAKQIGIVDKIKSPKTSQRCMQATITDQGANGFQRASGFQTGKISNKCVL